VNFIRRLLPIGAGISTLPSFFQGQPYNVTRAIIVFPSAAARSVCTSAHNRWLSRGKVARKQEPTEPLNDVLSILGLAPVGAGLAALRYQGQSGESPGDWIAAADPVHFETRLRHLVVRSLDSDGVSSTALTELFGDLQESLGGDDKQFVALGTQGYLRASRPMSTAPVSAETADGRVPDEFTPAGEDVETFHGLQGELQMLLHEHPINVARNSAGHPAVNSVWLWGGGVSPDLSDLSLPVLYADDRLFSGYWKRRSARESGWPGSFEQCVESAQGDFVAVVPDTDGNEEILLTALRRLLVRGTVSHLTIVVGQHFVIDVLRRDILKIWKSVSPHFREREEYG
jgi:hypothetical protein